MSAKPHVIHLNIQEPSEALALFGTNDKNLKRIEEQLNLQVTSRGEEVLITRSDQERVNLVEMILQALLDIIQKGILISERDVVYAIKLAEKGKINQLAVLFEDEITKNYNGKSIRVKTIGQKDYITAMKKQDLVFGIGPAGTGKTYLAVVRAVHALKTGLIKRIILARPAVEAGESLGFLPGDLKEKVDPYLRPLYDGLHDVLGKEQTERLIERGTIEIAPLAYMRGRTLNDAFVILDEAQNTTPEQMKMFLTRLGFESKMVITGDITQIDLPNGMASGLKIVRKQLHGVKGIGFIDLDETDVVRHPLVQRIIHAYEQYE